MKHKSYIFLGIALLLLIIIPNVSAVDETTTWDKFVDKFLLMFGTEPALQLESNDFKEQKYKLKKDVEVREFDYEVRTLSKSANVKEIWFEVYEQKECEDLHIEEYTTNDTMQFVNNTNVVKYDCSRYVKKTKQEINSALSEGTDFLDIKVKAEFGKAPEELCDPYRNDGQVMIGECDKQIIDFIPIYNGRKYTEYAQILMEGSAWNGALSNLQENATGVLNLDVLTTTLQDSFTTDTDRWGASADRICANISNMQMSGNLGTLGAKVSTDNVTDLIYELWQLNSTGNPESTGAINLGTCIVSAISSTPAWRNCTSFNQTVTLSAGVNYAFCINSTISDNGDFYWRMEPTNPTVPAWRIDDDWDYERSSDYEIWTSTGVDTTEGNFTSVGFGDGYSNNWNTINYLGFNNVMVRSSDDNSTWSTWVNVTDGNDIGIDNKKYLQVEGDCISNVCWGTYINISYLSTHPPLITITDPENTTYNDITEITTNITITSTIEPLDSVWYSFNGGINTTYEGNTTLQTLNGSNTIDVWANDTTGVENTSLVTFYINVAPSVPILNYPSNNSKIGNTTQELSCSGSTDINNDTINYEFYADTSNPPTTLLENSSLTTYTYSTEGNTYWRCRANDNQTNSDYTDSFYFQMNSLRIFNETMFNNSATVEGTSESFHINVTVNKWNVNTITIANLTYNGIDYTATPTLIDSQTDIAVYNIASTITIPNVDETIGIIGAWNITLNMLDGTTELNDTFEFNQTVNTIGISFCDGLQNDTQGFAINFTSWLETNNTMLNYIENETGFDMEFNIILWKDNKAANNTLLLSGTNLTEYDICISPPDSIYNIEGMVEYIMAGFDARDYYFQSATVSNTTQNINLYLLEQIYASNIPILVYDENNVVVDRAYIKVLRYDVSNDDYYLVAMGRTDTDGTDNIYLRKNDAWYKFMVIKDGATKFTDSVARKIVNTPVVLYYSVTSVGDILKAFQDMEYSLTNTSDYVVLTYNDPSGTSSKNCLSVTVVNGSYSAILCGGGDYCQTSSAGTITCDITNATGNIYAGYYSSINPDYLVAMIQFAHQFIAGLPDLGKTGVMGAFFIILTFGLIGVSLRRVSTAVIFTLVGVIFSVILGFLRFTDGATTWTVVVGCIILGVIIIVFAKE